MKTGLEALDRSAASRGGLLSGNALRGAVQYGQELGSQEYTNAFNRYQAERQARLGPLQSLTGMGQTTANTIGGMGSSYANNATGINMTDAANQANAGLVGARAMGNAIGQSAYTAGKVNWGNAFGGGNNTGGYGPQNPFQM